MRLKESIAEPADLRGREPQYAGPPVMVQNKSKHDDCIRVNLGQRSYDILVSQDSLQHVGRVLRERRIGGKDVMVFTSPTIGGLYYETLHTSLKAAGFNHVARHDIPDGEENKTPEQYQACLNDLITAFTDPKAVPLVINLGGGVVSDIGGFAAGTFRRGVPYVQVPTTLLGFVDCGVGGKVGVNHGDVKNIIGMFYQPSIVFADPAVLTTLPAREIRSGVAEVIKYGVVCDVELFEYLEKNIQRLVGLDPDVLIRVVGECYRIKAGVVEEDERDDKGVRIVLNYGHTIGHALEMSVHPTMTHGEAISVGMIGAARLGVRMGTCNQATCDRIERLIDVAGLPTSTRGHQVDLEQLMESIKHDKKAVTGSLRFVLPTGIGAWCEKDISDEGLVRDIVRSCLIS